MRGSDLTFTLDDLLRVLEGVRNFSAGAFRNDHERRQDDDGKKYNSTDASNKLNKLPNYRIKKFVSGDGYQNWKTTALLPRPNPLPPPTCLPTSHLPPKP